MPENSIHVEIYNGKKSVVIQFIFNEKGNRYILGTKFSIISNWKSFLSIKKHNGSKTKQVKTNFRFDVHFSVYSSESFMLFVIRLVVALLKWYKM